MSLKELLKEMCPNLLDEPRILLLKGLPGTGKTSFCLAFAKMWRKMDRSVLYFTTEHPPHEIREKIDGIEVVDGFSWRLGHGIDIKNLSFLSYTIKQAIADLNENDLFILDSITSLLFYNEPLNVAKFCELLVARLREKKVWGIFVIESGIHEKIIPLLERFMDCVFEFEMDGKRTIRVTGIKFLTGSLERFELDLSNLE